MVTWNTTDQRKGRTMSRTRTTAVLATGVLALGAVALPASAANAAPVECEPGTVDIAFSSSSTSFDAVTSVTVTNTGGSDVAVGAEPPMEERRAEVRGDVSASRVLAQARVDLAPSVADRMALTSDPVAATTRPAGGSEVTTYGFDVVEFTGAARTCDSAGVLGAPAYFGGDAPVGSRSAMDPVGVTDPR